MYLVQLRGMPRSSQSIASCAAVDIHDTAQYPLVLVTIGRVRTKSISLERNVLHYENPVQNGLCTCT